MKVVINLMVCIELLNLFYRREMLQSINLFSFVKTDLNLYTLHIWHTLKALCLMGWIVLLKGGEATGDDSRLRRVLYIKVLLSSEKYPSFIY